MSPLGPGCEVSLAETMTLLPNDLIALRLKFYDKTISQAH